MNFYMAQDRARRNTWQLLVLFMIAIAALVVFTYLFLTIAYLISGNVYITYQGIGDRLTWSRFFSVGLPIVLVVAAASVYKFIQLAKGGRGIAKQIGASPLRYATKDLYERRLLNVVEEMAIASGTPVPSVFVLQDEPAINAFAAGYTPNDAIIGVSSGAMQRLTREELQGVIAHEFSHILNGDIRLNMQLIGILHGILFIGILGSYLVRSFIHIRHGGRSARGTGLLPFGIVGLGLMVIGYGGTFFGTLIKLAVSRQREFLADASAVQFTRMPSGISGALKKIGGYKKKSYLGVPRAQEMSHMFFSDGIERFFSNLFSTHPSLSERIKRIEPRWNGELDSTNELVMLDDEAVMGFQGRTVEVRSAYEHSIETAIDDVGNIDDSQIIKAKQIIESYPTRIKDAVHDVAGARAILYTLVLNKKTECFREQMVLLKHNGIANDYQLTNEFHMLLKDISIELRLPLIELALPALREQDHSQFLQFKSNLSSLIKIDKTVDLFEWMLYRLMLHSVSPNFEKLQPIRARYRHLTRLTKPCRVVLSYIAHVGANNIEQARAAFKQGASELGMNNLDLIATDQLNLKDLGQSLSVFQRLYPLEKPKLLKALVACIKADKKVEKEEVELFRVIAEIIDCPVPPLGRSA